MTGLTDEEIDRQVALIEGWTCDDRGTWWPPSGTAIAPPVIYDYADPPPYRSDWRLCGPLLEKMQATIFVGSNFASVHVHAGKQCSGFTACDGDTKRAICLAYIAANAGACSSEYPAE